MITLTVKTNQEAYDTVKANLAKMPRQAIGADGICSYETPEGLNCAIGGIATDPRGLEDAGVKLGISSVSSLVMHDVLDVGDVSVYLLSDLQYVHDRSSYWSERGFIGWDALAHVGARHGLS